MGEHSLCQLALASKLGELQGGCFSQSLRLQGPLCPSGRGCLSAPCNCVPTVCHVACADDCMAICSHAKPSGFLRRAGGNGFAAIASTAIKQVPALQMLSAGSLSWIHPLGTQHPAAALRALGTEFHPAHVENMHAWPIADRTELPTTQLCGCLLVNLQLVAAKMPVAAC